MDPEEKVQSIQFGFYSADLLGNADPRRYDVNACARRYAHLCQEALEQAYPGCKIEISFESDERTQVNGLSDSSEVDVVEEIREKVYQGFSWEVIRPWLDVTMAHQRFGMPTSVIRWACREGVIREAEKPKGYWEFPQEAFLEARMIPALAACKEVLAFETTSDGPGKVIEHYPYGRLDACVAQMTAGVKLLVVLPDEIEHHPWFTKENSLLLLSRNVANLDLEVEHSVDAIQWTDTKWAYDAFARAMVSQANRRPSVRGYVDEINTHDGNPLAGMHIAFSFHDWQVRELNQLLSDALNILKEMVWDSEIELAGGPQWRIEYEKDEALFCQEILGPLLRRMGFLDVRYTHGVGEFGKDFTFSEMTKFGEVRYCALQAKAGAVKGGVKAEIDELLGQINDAFENEYDGLGDVNPRRISTFVIAISGSFTDNAETKIRNKIRRTIVGSVHFLDKERILGLIDHYWSPKE